MKINFIYLIIILTELLTSCIKDDVYMVNISATVGHEVQFENIDYNPNEYNYLWDFGDGYVSNETTPVHIYKFPGVYSVNITRYKKSGAFVSKDCFFTVNATQIYRPRINSISIKSINHNYLYINEDIECKTILSYKQGKNKDEYSFKLEIEDGTTYYSQDNVHIFADTGMTNLKFYISDKNGTSSSLDTSIFIGNTISRLFFKIPETYNSQLGIIKERYCFVYDVDKYNKYNNELSGILEYKYNPSIKLINNNEIYISSSGFYRNMVNLAVYPLPIINNNEYFSITFPAFESYYEHHNLKIIIVQIGTLKKAIGTAEFNIVPGSTTYHNVIFTLYNY